MPQTEVGRSEDLLAELAKWVAMETPTTDAASVNRLMDVAEGELARAGATLTRIPGRDGFGDNLIARTPGEGNPVLVAGHLDTVWSHGTLDGMPYQVNGEKAHGPGIYDMKAGSFLAFHAVCSILQQGTKTRRPIVLLLTPDEEVGSPTSREWIEREAAEAACVLIPEPAGQGGACVTARKGVGRFVMRVEGRGAHSGGSVPGWRIGGGGAGAADRADPRNGRSRSRHHAERGAGVGRVAAERDLAGCRLRDRSAGEFGRRWRTHGAHAAGDHGADAGLPRGGGGRHEPSAVSPRAPGSWRCTTRRVGSPRRWGSRCRGSIAAADRMATSPPRWACRRSMVWAVPVPGAHASHEHILWQHLAPRAALMAGLLETLE